MISREQWGARNPKSVTALPISKVNTIVIHYSAAAVDEVGPYGLRVRNIQNYHMDVNHWNDIAYNFLVSRTGEVYEGRGFGIQSAATLGHNDHTYAICFLGNDTKGKDDVTDKGRKAITDLIVDYEGRKGAKLLVKGHRDFVATDCPGQELYHWIVTGGYKKSRPLPLPPGLPSWFWKWVAWRQGEGDFKRYGPQSVAHRPKNVPERIPPVAWLGLRIFLTNRKLG